LLSRWFVLHFEWTNGIDDHSLDVNPGQLVIREAFLFPARGLCVLQEHDSCEEVHQKEVANQHEANEEHAINFL